MTEPSSKTGHRELQWSREDSEPKSPESPEQQLRLAYDLCEDSAPGLERAVHLRTFYESGGEFLDGILEHRYVLDQLRTEACEAGRQDTHFTPDEGQDSPQAIQRRGIKETLINGYVGLGDTQLALECLDLFPGDVILTDASVGIDDERVEKVGEYEWAITNDTLQEVCNEDHGNIIIGNRMEWAAGIFRNTGEGVALAEALRCLVVIKGSDKSQNGLSRLLPAMAVHGLTGQGVNVLTEYGHSEIMRKMVMPSLATRAIADKKPELISIMAMEFEDKKNRIEFLASLPDLHQRIKANVTEEPAEQPQVFDQMALPDTGESDRPEQQKALPDTE